jgi:hypothetical protein
VGGGRRLPGVSVNRATVACVPRDPEAEELKAAQRKREASEKELTRSATDEHEAAQHERRAEKARYLRDKLEERTASERDTER